MKGIENMVILNFKSMNTIEILRCFKKLCEVDKLRLAINLLDSKYLHLDINKAKEIMAIEKRLVELSYETIINFNEHKYLVFLSAKFMELSEYDKNILVVEILANICEDFEY